MVSGHLVDGRMVDGLGTWKNWNEEKAGKGPSG
jgi:hypothetical protein